MSQSDVVRPVDFAAAKASGERSERYRQELITALTGSRNAMITYIVTPPGSGSPEGLHKHVVDQIFYVLAGTMNIEINGQEHEVPAGNLIVFPEGVAHRNWNGGSEQTIHIAINTPAPNPAEPFARPV